MQFSLSRYTLQKALDQIQFAFQPGTYIQECLKITLRDGQLSFSLATAHAYAISTVSHAEGTPGDVLVHYPSLQKLLDCFQGEMLHVQYDGTQAILSDEKIMLMLRDCPPVRDFPAHPKLRYAQMLHAQKDMFQHSWQLTIPAPTWQHLVKMVANAAAPAESGKVFEGVAFRMQDDVLTLVAADRTHLHMMEISVPGAGTWNVTPVVPANLLLQATQGIAREEHVIISTITTLQQKVRGEISSEVPFLSLRTGAREAYLALLPKTYPDVFVLFPKEYTTRATCECDELRKALAQLRSLIRVCDAPVQVHFGPQELLLEVSCKGMEQPVRQSIPAQINGEERTKKYHWETLNRLTKLNRDSKVTFECGPSDRTKILLEKEPTFQALVLSGN